LKKRAEDETKLVRNAYASIRSNSRISWLR